MSPLDELQWLIKAIWNERMYNLAEFEGPENGWRDFPQWVYVMKCGYAVKIGYAADPKLRRDELQTGNPHQIDFRYAFGVDDEMTARDIEKKTHSKLAEEYLRGEWFSVKPDYAAMCIIVAAIQTAAIRSFYDRSSHTELYKLIGLKD